MPFAAATVMDIWDQVLLGVGKKVNQQCFDTWFRPIIYKGCDSSALRLTVPNESFKQCLLENYSEVLHKAIGEAAGSDLKLSISVGAPLNREKAFIAGENGDPGLAPPLLNAKYTFDSFVVGASNQFAQAAAKAVADQPSKAYNPLYVYGGVGLGKTHLMHAIGHQILRQNGKARLSYMSSERFMNELVNSIRYDKTNQFRQKYRNIDVLLMDDIQFIAGKERTQEEFFHTFNALYDAQKQIVITSDCPPREIPTIEERLHSRFQWGLIADIQPPDLETKLAILKKKADAMGLPLSDSVAMYLASCVRSNIRELEGALNRLGARASLDGLDVVEIDVAYAKDVLKDIVAEDRNIISSEMIIRAVCAHFGLRSSQLKTKSNARLIAQPRQVAMFLCKQLTKMSLPEIGKDFGGKHHTTVLHSIRKIDELQKKDAETASVLRKIIQSIK
jgi:chromosomal replication initiator protein